MDISMSQGLLILLLILVPLLYEWSATFKYFCKMAFYNGWILTLAVLAIPICAVRGRNVENMKVLQFMLLHIKYLYGIKIDVKGWENFPVKEQYVVVSNHQSSLDLLGMMEILPGRCVPIAKRELMYAGTAGLACWLAGVIFINRKKTDDAISVMSEAAQTMIMEDVRVWVFPEGTRNHDGSMLPFKRGAFHLAVQAQVPIVPVVMSSYKDFYNKKERKFTTGRCSVRILPPINTRGLSSNDVPELADRTRELMLSTFLQISNSSSSSQNIANVPGHLMRTQMEGDATLMKA
ncbi:1-acyl-sn-glycerol-3-phosphate acyltransferase alpha-like [Polypterus senegalus]|uniref:1-acyl-sn-glycerol-3-phosphate acyltransferase alpha-like n=1 Tax=Polypterus senegalus TaxID=55291 RepID=UPI0019645C14|nr:1-acyl-sn-glycerol-3-phosphate acyltransferase alpha-like [Polypterus senegalus]XP_039624667.1 1-acyl-sn-glycerol-3-phosphate acyltransferase alpha-like [Polypterus senegalus]